MEQQAQILRSFLDQLEREEVEDELASNGIAGEFARLKNQSLKLRADKNYPTKTAEKQENIKKNRYKDILPFDHSRVRLTLATAKNDTDYINASFIKGMSGSRAYIATQGPLPHTVLDFLRMLWEYKITVVVMACREFEMGKKKCECYWPPREEQPFVCGPFKVYCDSEENKGDYLTRVLRVTYCNCSRTLKQLHYVNWPDHGVPDSVPPILEILHEMRSYQDHDDIPICIHCSAGCGRTGVLCVIDYTWNLLKKQMITPDFNIYDLVLNMRTQRPLVVQTKEQYELVYRTIKLLFQRYLESVDAQPCRNEVTKKPTSPAPDVELSQLSEEPDLLPQFQQLPDEERDILQQYHTPLPSASENLIIWRAQDGCQIDEQQWHLHQTSPDALLPTQHLQEGPRSSPKLGHASQRAPATGEKTQESDDIQAPAIAEAICQMVEDPYFDTPMSSPSSEEAFMDSAEDAKEWIVSPVFSKLSLLRDLKHRSHEPGTAESLTDEDLPPPLPERTPESYILAVDTADSNPCEMLKVIIPPNAAAEAVRDLGGSTPTPPLPERTPESYELAVNEAAIKQNLEVIQPAKLDRIGISSEWSGSSVPAASASQLGTKPWMRSKSMKAKTTFTGPVTHFDLAPNTTSSLHPFDPPLGHLTPPLSQTEDSLTPSLPERTPESFILNTGEVQVGTAQCPQPLETTQNSPRADRLFERNGTSHPKKFLDAMSRSKSVRTKSLSEVPLTAVQLTPPLVVTAEGGSAQAGQNDVNHRPFLNADTPGNKSDKSNEKGMSRTKSLRFFRHKQKPKTTPPPPPAQPETPSLSQEASSPIFKFGFGSRFKKPKGPRNYPDTWS
ncbi:tyrosine-protein phosphatase non-receptor type 22 isoform X2 [Mastacembelus armatus]|uniref:tyrosine-protein phosphatase non-receptor type 22 isoform X2 n=1 Tax=Mastacembelus armatus TaxID=205130 RepID=UPI000E4557BC|nr:tyrosine-protein phosphatase non-receptor type 22-like isoform X2 [Mastacembelus armatus]